MYSYEIKSNEVRCITKKLNIPRDIIYRGRGPSKFRFINVNCKWLKGDHRLLIADKYDYWLLDPLGESNPISLTDGLGRKQNICFSFAEELSRVDLIMNDLVYLTGLDNESKNNGFWASKIGVNGSLNKKSMDSCLFWFGTIAEGYRTRLKASKDLKFFAVNRETANESRNVFVSTDLKTFRKISDINPEKKFKWFRTELITYPLSEGRLGKGILFKPDDFDPNSTYPVIFNYYQERSNELNVFRQPELSGANIDVGWYLSNGYLVFMPDMINYGDGNIVKNTLDAAESAVRYLIKYPWFDSNRIGIQGQSFGGFETNILATHSKMFKAAVTVAGISDLVSYAGSAAWGGSGQNFVEVGQVDMRVLPWTDPISYVRNSPIFEVNKCITPLLIIHGQDDKEAVPIEQAQEFFFALRREKKKVWFINYKKSGHTIGGDKQEDLDFAIRMQQFFDHYLKGIPAPLWMLEQQTTTFNNYVSDFKLDSLNRTP